MILLKEEVLKIFRLFLKSKNNIAGEILYQIFIEPKGDQLIELDKEKRTSL